jgi:hypothetical protein
MTPFYHFLNGMNAMGMLACGLMFLRAWKKTSDRLFLIFGLAFWVMTIERILLELHPRDVLVPEAVSNVYILRLISFVMILYAIIDKNRSRSNY